MTMERSQTPDTAESAPASLLVQLRQRQVIQTVILYVAVGWGFYEIASEYLEQFGFPAYSPRLLLVILLLGFPAAVFLSWYFDADRRGIHRDGPLTRRAWLVVAASLLLPLVGAFVAFPYLNRQAETAIAQRADVVPLAQLAPNSLAVRPFQNFSFDAAFEVLAAGLGIEIWNRLVKVPVLKLAHRERSFAPDLAGASIEEVAVALRSRYVLGGDIRVDEDRMRVTATLTDAASGDVVWTRAYDRLLVDMFAVQDDVATAITDAIVGAGTAEAFIKPGYRPETDMDAYMDYLRFLSGLNTPESAEAYFANLRRVVEQNSDFVEAYALLAMECYWAAAMLQESPGGEMYGCAWDAARRAVELNAGLDPAFQSSAAHLALAYANQLDWNWIGAEENIAQARLLAPSDNSIPLVQGDLWLFVGRTREAIALIESTLENSGDPWKHVALAWAYHDAGDSDKVIEHGEAALAEGIADANYPLGYALMRIGESGRALALLEEAEERQFGIPVEFTRAWFEAMHDESKWQDLVVLADRLIADGRITEAMALNNMLDEAVADQYFARAYRHIEDRQLLVRILWRESASDLRADSRFEELVGQLNVLPYWERYGWADLCEPRGAAFECFP